MKGLIASHVQKFFKDIGVGISFFLERIDRLIDPGSSFLELCQWTKEEEEKFKAEVVEARAAHIMLHQGFGMMA
ncbi:hypothetical protein RND71_041688 [Anisodus tanguticus]|uniref:Uncharacterized protein n=1 Tax=Anisodus tanguticus TaxID=243964 RepID=A0AAE1UUK4_9SOLA|nr:hypothetical protein RND71_041688 [Anisodus tanguticus]